MTIDDYFAAVERGLRQNVQTGGIEEPITCLALEEVHHVRTERRRPHAHRAPRPHPKGANHDNVHVRFNNGRGRG